MSAVRRVLRKGFAKTRRERGFSLLESLTALTIFAIALSALMELYTADVRVLSASRGYSGAQTLLRSLSAIELSDSSAPIANKRGAAGRYSWTLTAEPAALAPGIPEPGGAWTLQKVRLTVSWRPGRRISMTTIRMRPRDE